MNRNLSFFRFILLALAWPGHGAPPPRWADVIIYGATPGGLAAATAAGRQGVPVIVVNPSTQVGGMITGGIAVTDTGTPNLVGGIAAEFFNQVAAEEARSAPPVRQPEILFRGKTLPFRKPARWDLEPKVARGVFESWAAKGKYEILNARTLAGVSTRNGEITSIRLNDGMTLTGKVFIDASYEGDLMTKAGVSSTYGRESRAQYGEKLAGAQLPHFTRYYPETVYQVPGNEYMHHGQFGAGLPGRDGQGKLLWGVEDGPEPVAGSADKRLQAYCYRLVVTQRRDLRLPWPNPKHYDPSRYRLLLLYVQAHPGISFARLVHLAPVPNGKFDLNASGPFSIDFVGGNTDYPALDYVARERMLRAHRDYEQGFFWFLSHDRRVPAELREEVNTWGIAKDEWSDTDHWPTQLYIRESRRMTGEYVMTERDIVRDKLKPDSIGMGSFVLDSHWVRRYADAQGFVRVEGHLDESINLAQNPYEIPYRSITPKVSECRNLLVPVCLSASHVAICTIRMEPVYMILGHSAGVAAAMAVRSGKAVQEIDIAELLRILGEQGQILHSPRKK